MGVVFNGLSVASYTISGSVINSLPQPASTQTPTVFQHASNSTNLVTIGTPTEGKTFYCMGFTITNESGSAYYVDIYKADGTTIMYEINMVAGSSIVIPCPGIAYANATPPKFICSGACGGNIQVSAYGFEV